jgi:hypothetical protein
MQTTIVAEDIRDRSSNAALAMSAMCHGRKREPVRTLVALRRKADSRLTAPSLLPWVWSSVSFWHIPAYPSADSRRSERSVRVGPFLTQKTSPPTTRAAGDERRGPAVKVSPSSPAGSASVSASCRSYVNKLHLVRQVSLPQCEPLHTQPTKGGFSMFSAFISLSVTRTKRHSRKRALWEGRHGSNRRSVGPFI